MLGGVEEIHFLRSSVHTGDEQKGIFINEGIHN